MSKIISLCIFPIALTAAHMSFAAEQCPAINCDCDSLPSESWIEVCTQYETKIKQNCVDNLNTPKDYCLVHGLDASPLALAIQPNSVAPVSSDELKALREKLSSLAWGVESDIEKATEAFDQKVYSRTLKILKFVDANLDQMFENQQRIHETLVENNDSSSRAWRDYAKSVVKYNEKVQVFGDYVASSIGNAKSTKEKKIFNVLSKKIYRMSGKSYEHAGYAFGRAKKYANAAEQWEKSAEVSVTLAAIDNASGGSKSAKFSEYQAAARLHRASYYWISANKINDASESLKESQKYVGRQGQEGLELLVNNADDSGDGILSGR